jgi:hypothetical protein
VETSPLVRTTLTRREEQQRQETWFRHLMTQLRDRARSVELPLGELNRQLGDTLTLSVTTGGPGSEELLRAAGVDDERFFAPRVPGATEGAVCLLIHSQQGIEGFPTIVVRVWPSFDRQRLWLLRAPMISPHRTPEAVATFLAPWLLSVFGPFPPFRQSTIDLMLDAVDETNALFMALVEQYLEIVDAGGDPADQRAWQDRVLRK